MKQTTLHLITLLILALTTLSATAHDFEVDGIYYNINGTEATVTYQGSSYGQYINEYTGDVTIPETVTYGATTYSVTSIDHYAFYECPDLTSINIPNSVIGIGNYAFYNCTGLESVIIPNSVIGIGRNAFVSCGRLVNIILGSSLSFIDESAFFHCDNLASITSFSSEPPYIYEPVFPIDALLSANLHIPVKSISAYKHADYWEDFSNIVEISFEIDGIWYCALTDNTAMVIQRPDEDNSYHGDVIIPDSVTYQGFTFSVSAIDASAFEDCYELASVVIGDAVETIGENAFQGCTGLTSVTIGSGVASIGAKAFNYCNALTTVTCRGTVPPVMANTNCFSNAAYSRATLVVPRQQLEAYQAADYWYRFSNIDGWGSAGMGDVNADGIIGISDVTALTNALLTNSTDPALLEYGDLNHNGRLDIGDVTNLIVTLLTH